MPKVQIITRRVKASRRALSSVYRRRVHYDIRRRIEPEAEILFIQLLPDVSISEKDVLKSYLQLQREFTEHIIIPTNTVDFTKEEINQLNASFGDAHFIISSLHNPARFDAILYKSVVTVDNYKYIN